MCKRNQLPNFLFQSFIILLIGLLPNCSTNNFGPVPTGLMTDLLTRPEEAVITSASPRFSWIVPADTTLQTAYQILISSNPKLLQKVEGDIWDSGKITSNESISVGFNGDKLNENVSYWWKVRTWDQNDIVSSFSLPQKFNTGEFNSDNKKWPGESRWVTLSGNGEKRYVLENRQLIDYDAISPQSITLNSKRNNFITFEKAAFGTLQLNLDEVTQEKTIIVHLGEKSTSNQEVDKNPGGSILYQKAVLNLTPGVNQYTLEFPRFISHYPNSQILAERMPEVTSFRYVEIEGLSSQLKKEQVKQYALLYPFNDNASNFNSSNENLNQIWELCKHTLKVTPFLGVYIDGGGRERMPYEADAYMQQVSHYCVDREFAIQRYTTDFLIYNPSWPTEWHLHIVLMAWADYMATGDARFLEKRYDELKKKTLGALAREDGLISTRTGLVTPEFLKSIHYNGKSFRDIVDWPQGTPANETELRSGHGSVSLEGETDRYIFSDINTVVNAYYYRNLVLMSKIAAVLNKSDEEQYFKNKASLVKASLNAKLFNTKTGLYTDGEGVKHSALHANMFPVAFGLAPDSIYSGIKDFLISKGMGCSPGMALYLLQALYEVGAEDYALDLLTSETDRSWMNMIRFGTTVTSEAWDIKYKRNMTWNHAWGAIPAYIISREICGIEPLEPSFKKIKIHPQPGNLEWAKIKHPTIRGSIDMEFKNHEDAFVMDLTLPSNTLSDIYMPARFKDYTLFCNGKAINAVKTENRALIENVKPGKYTFEMKRMVY